MTSIDTAALIAVLAAAGYAAVSVRRRHPTQGPRRNGPCAGMARLSTRRWLLIAFAIWLAVSVGQSHAAPSAAPVAPAFDASVVNPDATGRPLILIPGLAGGVPVNASGFDPARQAARDEPCTVSPSPPSQAPRHNYVD